MRGDRIEELLGGIVGRGEGGHLRVIVVDRIRLIGRDRGRLVGDEDLDGETLAEGGGHWIVWRAPGSQHAHGSTAGTRLTECGVAEEEPKPSRIEKKAGKAVMRLATSA